MAQPTNTSGLLDNLSITIPDISSLPLPTEIKHIDRTAGKFVDQLPEVMLSLSLGVGLIIAGWLLSGWLAGKMTRVMVRARIEETLAAFLGSTARFMLFFTIFVVALTFMGLSSTSLAALLGAIGLAIGLAVKGTLGHVASGVMLMVHRPIKVGDWVENTTVSGTVKRIGMFSTEINTQEFVRVFIPNTLLWENILRNHTYNRMRMLKLSFSLSYEVDVRKAFEVVKETLAASPLALKSPEPVVGVDSFGEHGIICLLHIWVRTEDRSALKNTVLLDVMEALKKAGIRMAHMDKLEKAAAEGTNATAPGSDAGMDAPKASAVAAKDGKVKA